jgi:AhpD family alkylhydroperoxidase
MKQRFKMKDVLPLAYNAMGALEDFAKDSSIEPRHQELMRLRASQINGCAYCVNYHTNNARKLGESEVRLSLVCVWKEAPSIFTEEEQLLLGMSEEVTLIHQNGLSDSLYKKSVAMFGEKKTAQIIMTIVAINVWNRASVALHLQPEIDS